MPKLPGEKPHRHSDPKASPRPRTARKPKPKFEIPATVAGPADAAAVDVGWVYRADQPLAPVEAQDIKAAVAEVAAEVRHVPPAELAADAVLAAGRPAAPLPPLPPPAQPAPSAASFAVVAGLGVIAIGAITTGLASLVALSFIAAPFRMVRGLFSRD